MKEVKSITESIKSILKSMGEITITHTKQVSEVVILAFFLALMLESRQDVQTTAEKTKEAQDTKLPEQFTFLHPTVYAEEEEAIRNEIFYGELEEVALLVQAEAGNQDELGKRYVADCIFNRVDDEDFPDTISEVIYQINPVQFATTIDGSMEKAAYTITEDVFQIVLEESEERTDSDIIYFRTGRYGCGTPAFKHGDHYFSTK
jgi:N-acetylmuramoyl-L-alanine amidase